jgi:hypothetical protein
MNKTILGFKRKVRGDPNLLSLIATAVNRNHVDPIYSAGYGLIDPEGFEISIERHAVNSACLVTIKWIAKGEPPAYRLLQALTSLMYHKADLQGWLSVCTADHRWVRTKISSALKQLL